MRVLILLKYIPTVDADRKSDSLLSTVRAHEEEGHSVLLLTSGRAADCEWKVIDGTLPVTGRIYKKLAGVISSLKADRYQEHCIVRSVECEHRQKKIDVMLAVCTSRRPALYAREIKAATGIPYVVREHRIYEGKKTCLDDMDAGYLTALREADALVAVSPHLADIMMDLGIRDDIGVFPNAISDEFFDPPAEGSVVVQKIREWAGDGFVFGGWTRWRTFKRVDLLLKAFSELSGDVPDAKLLIAGPIEPEQDHQWVRSFVAEHNLSDSVFLFGVADRDEIHGISHGVDCGVVPSDFETFGLPALEAAAAGKPVVTTRCNGPEYIIDSEKLGRTVERDNVTELAAAMRNVYERRHEFDSEAIRDSIFRRFSRSSLGPQFTGLYRDVLGTKPKC